MYKKSGSFFKVIFFSLLLVFLLFSLTVKASARSSKNNFNSELLNKKTLTVGLEGTYAPYSYRQNNKLTGFEVDLASQIAKKISFEGSFCSY
ncbi:hypothetical protein Q757_08110 [Oenococcus alcoholitolerans]|uniref:Solute-binding protein family 3/N-terminal domain-containing protein n=1 Tax=Oenococcus alcoholitolerans TaxID=931074 RepID=A0ABR4XPD2_9LACO|nr:hypothetical protein Q757_08110 [Oenococcus alcoholitolerans]